MELLKEGLPEKKAKRVVITCYNCNAEMEVSFNDFKFYQAGEITFTPLYACICPWCEKENYLSESSFEGLF